MPKSKLRRSSSSSKDSGDGTGDRFERKPFEGNRQDFLELVDCIKTAVMNKCDEIGFNYLFPLNPWQYDNATGVFINIPDEYKLKLDLNPPAANATAATIELYNSRQKIIDKRNTKFRELRSDMLDIVVCAKRS